jgi:Domain of unknown function (DUF4838)/Glycosyl hydrolase family 67 N-terminus
MIQRWMVLYAFVAASFVTVQTGAETVIVVDKGPFESIADAASGEASVDWNDVDKTDDTACTECFAATELQHYLRKLTGRVDDFALAEARPGKGTSVISVGQTASKLRAKELSALDTDGYRIVTTKRKRSGARHIAIAGKTRLGSLYGVYDFLHRLGCRWYAPGEMHEVIPKRDLNSMPSFDASEEPDYAIRGFHAWEKRGNPDFIIWMARNRLNYWCVEEDDHPRLRKLGIKMVWGGHEVCSDYIKPNDPYPYQHANLPAKQELPADPYPVTEAFLGDENGDGALSYWEAHPEWYAMDPDGKRVKQLGYANYNFCTSNPHAMAESMRKAVRELVDGEAQDAEIVNCWTVDVGKWCHCDACKEQGIPSDRNLRCVYAFDQEVKKAQKAGLINRDITILFLVYHDVLEPPVHPLPDDFDYGTSIATFFPITRSYTHNFDDPDDPRNADYLKHLHGWAVEPERHYKGQICIGEYYNVSGFKCLPMCYMHTMANDIPYYYDAANARYFHYMHVTTGNWGNKALTNYQMARQIWDVDTDCEALWLDYFTGRYGAAADKMRAFYESLETMLCNCRDLKYTLPPRLENGQRPIFNGRYLILEPEEGQVAPSWRETLAAKAECRAILDEVQAMALSEHAVARVAEDEGMFTYGEKTLEFYDAMTCAYNALDDGNMDVARKAYGESRELAAVLEADTVSTMDFVSPASDSPNALHASRAAAGLEVLYDLIGPLSDDEYVALDLAKQLCVMSGGAFRGGGAPHWGYGINATTGRVSDAGNVVYGQHAGSAKYMTAYFTLKQPPTGPVTLKLTGVSRPVTDDGTVTGRVEVNGLTVHDGDIPLDWKALSTVDLNVKRGILKLGANKIKVTNTADEGHRGSRPWFGVHEVELVKKR